MAEIRRRIFHYNTTQKNLNYLIDLNDEKMVEIAIKKENKGTFFPFDWNEGIKIPF